MNVPKDLNLEASSFLFFTLALSQSSSVPKTYGCISDMAGFLSV